MERKKEEKRGRTRDQSEKEKKGRERECERWTESKERTKRDKRQTREK